MTQILCDVELKHNVIWRILRVFLHFPFIKKILFLWTQFGFFNFNNHYKTSTKIKKSNIGKNGEQNVIIENDLNNFENSYLKLV